MGVGRSTLSMRSGLMGAEGFCAQTAVAANANKESHALRPLRIGGRLCLAAALSLSWFIGVRFIEVRMGAFSASSIAFGACRFREDEARKRQARKREPEKRTFSPGGMTPGSLLQPPPTLNLIFSFT